MFEQLGRSGSFVRVLHQTPTDKVDEGRRPLVGFTECGWVLRRDHEHGAHGMHLAVRWLPFGHLQRGDAQTPDVTATPITNFLDYFLQENNNNTCARKIIEFFFKAFTL